MFMSTELLRQFLNTHNKAANSKSLSNKKMFKNSALLLVARLPGARLTRELSKGQIFCYGRAY